MAPFGGCVVNAKLVMRLTARRAWVNGAPDALYIKFFSRACAGYIHQSRGLIRSSQELVVCRLANLYRTRSKTRGHRIAREPFRGTQNSHRIIIVLFTSVIGNKSEFTLKELILRCPYSKFPTSCNPVSAPISQPLDKEIQANCTRSNLFLSPQIIRRQWQLALTNPNPFFGRDLRAHFYL